MLSTGIYNGYLNNTLSVYNNGLLKIPAVYYINEVFVVDPTMMPAVQIIPDNTRTLIPSVSWDEDEDRIESIIGMDIPEFTVESSELTHFQSFDAESTTHATLKFKSLPNKQFFDDLDSICKLEAPDTLAPNSKIFVAGLESYYNPWSKEKNEYQFSMIGDPLNKTLHKEDAFFMLTIKKNSPYSELSYGNF